ncbi:MAG: immunoglobulin-like domain-containing protein [Candidatus Eiseniibacteriota bacterium]
MGRPFPSVLCVRRPHVAPPFALALTVVFALALGAIESQAQTLVSDKLDYAPGTTAVFTGSGFAPSEFVQIEVTPSAAPVESWTVVADEMGNFVTSWEVCYCPAMTLRATAYGTTSGLQAECFFTDATMWTLSITPPSVGVGVTQSFVLTANNTSTGGGNQMGCITITIPPQFTPSGSPTIVPGSTTHSWSVVRVGQLVTATANSNGDRLDPDESIQIRITATAPGSTAGSPFPWNGVARTNTNCSGSSFGTPDGGQPTVAVVCTPAGISCPPNITVNADPGLCSAVVNFAATATGNPAPAITYSKNPGTVFPVGVTTVTVTATNACGSASCSFTVTVLDNQAPVVTLVGPNPITVECHTSFTDPGATSSDNCPGGGAVPASGGVDVNVVGSYTLTYTATDASGNVGTASRTVNVVDTTNPVVTLSGPADVTLECHGPAFADPGASASDACAGALSVSVSGSVDVNTVGDHVLIYTATDPSGNSGSTTRTVHVVDTTNPVVTLSGPADVTLECHGPAFADPGASAADACAGALSVSVSGSVDVNTVGDYVLTYTATDPSGNSGSATRTVHVVDTTNPVVTLSGPADVTLECHGPAFADPGATAADACAGALSVSVSGAVDVNTVGDYVLTYSATDPSANSGSTTRTIHVVDTTNPVVTLSGPGDVTLECHGAAFTDPGATAADACAGALSVSVSGTVDVNTVGDYVLTYAATDPSGNSGSTTRTVHVVDTTPPTIGAPAASATIECPNMPAFPVPSASDACDANPEVVEVSDVTTPGSCPGSYVRTKTWKAVDAHGNSSESVSQTVTVIDSTPPTIGSAGADATISCPSAPVFAPPTASDGCDSNPQVIEVSDVTSPGSCAGSYVRTKTWRARDCSGNQSGTVSQTITVVDVTPPTAAITAPPSGTVVAAGTPLTFTGNAGDNCGLQSARWQFDSIVVPAGPIGLGGAIMTTYVLTTPGVYQVKLIVDDACGNSVTASQTPEGFDWTVIVYDPNAGFVTGGGWIYSPPGAYRPNPALEGKANFGFVSKYHRGSRVPTGETEFQFKTAGLNFHSSAYEWLVVAGAKAQYRGAGTINGGGSYDFLLTAIDGSIQGGGKPDKLRMKIWDRVSGGVVYDNQNGQPDDSDASTVLGGGSIEIHSDRGGLRLTSASSAALASAGPEFAIQPARPNPFVGTTQFGFDLPEPSRVTIVVYDVRGRRVATVTDEVREPGSHAAAWSARSDGGARLESGVYFAHVEVRSLVSERHLTAVRKLTLSR